MQHLDLLGAFRNQVDLDSFARAFFPTIEVSHFEERESSNYVEGRYYKGRNGTLNLTISLSDEDGHKDLPCWIHVTADMQTPEALAEVVKRTIGERVLPAGFRLAQMINLGRQDEIRFDY